MKDEKTIELEKQVEQLTKERDEAREALQKSKDGSIQMIIQENLEQKITKLEAQKQSMGRTMWKDQKKISELEADNKDLEKEVIRYKEGG